VFFFYLIFQSYVYFIGFRYITFRFILLFVLFLFFRFVTFLSVSIVFFSVCFVLLSLISFRFSPPPRFLVYRYPCPLWMRFCLALAASFLIGCVWSILYDFVSFYHLAFFAILEQSFSYMMAVSFNWWKREHRYIIQYIWGETIDLLKVN
jgi:hypothetical protein